MYRGVKIFIVFAFLIFGSQILISSNQTFADTDELWQGQIDLLELGDAPLAENKSNSLCETVDVKSRYISQGFVSRKPDSTIVIDSSKETKSAPQSLCAVQNGQGLFAGNLWSRLGNKDSMLRLVPTNLSYDPAPGGSVVLVKTIAPQGQYVSINYNLLGVGRLDSSNAINAELQWRLINYADSVRYSNNQPVQVLSSAFSANGKFLVAHLSNGYAVVIDLQNQQMKPFYLRTGNNARFNYLAVSGDGNFVLSYHSGSLLLHDLTKCTGPVHLKDSWPASGLSTAGCANQNLYSRASALFPLISNSTNPIARLRFSADSSSFTVDAGWRDNNNNQTWKRLKFSSSGYVPKNVGYLAMGDSFSSGEGDLNGEFWYEPGTDEAGNSDTFENRNLCHLSRRSYPYLIASQLDLLDSNLFSPPADGLFHSVACSGAKIQNIFGNSEKGQINCTQPEQSYKISDNQYCETYLGVLDRWQPGRIKQLDFLEKQIFGGYLQSEQLPEAITIGIGGNDAGFGDIILACAMPGTCKYAEPSTDHAQNIAVSIATLKPKLVETYKRVKQSSPNSRIYVHGYPQFVQPGGNCAVNVLLDQKETELVYNGIDYMNKVIEASAKEAGVFYVDVSNILENKNLCSSAGTDQKAFNGITYGDDKTHFVLNFLTSNICKVRGGCIGNESFHPNSLGHSLYAERILQSSSNLSTKMPEAQKTDYPLPADFFGENVKNAISQANITKTVLEEHIQLIELKSMLQQGFEDTLKVQTSGLLPGSSANLFVRSNPILIDTFSVNQNGELNIAFELPEGLGGGIHDLYLEAVAVDGKPVAYYEPFFVPFTFEDFDGDGATNETDSCPSVTNSGIDIDDDGIDDICDEEALPPPPEEEIVEEDPVDENPSGEEPVDETDKEEQQNEEENEGEVLAETEEPLIKGEPSSETVAGDEPETGQVLGTNSEDSEVLAETGRPGVFNLLIGLLLVVSTILVTTKKGCSGSYHIRRK